MVAVVTLVRSTTPLVDLTLFAQQFGRGEVCADVGRVWPLEQPDDALVGQPAQQREIEAEQPLRGPRDDRLGLVVLLAAFARS